MGQMLIRQIDDDVLDRLRKRAQQNNRSVAAEVRTILTEAVREPEAARRSLMSFVGVGQRRRSQAEIDAEIAALRDEWDHR